MLLNTAQKRVKEVRRHIFLMSDQAEIKLDFTFDADLAKIPTAEKPSIAGNPSEVKDIVTDPPPAISMPTSATAPLHRSTAVVTASVTDLVSPAADDLNMKIASVKNVWERENHVSGTALAQYFEQR